MPILKILVGSPTSFPNMRGLYEYNLCHMLEDDGQDVCSLTLSGDNSTYCRRAVSLSSGRSALRVLLQQAYSPALHKILCQEMPHVIHVNSPLWSFLALQTTVLKKLSKLSAKIVITTHSFDTVYEMSPADALREFAKTFDPKVLLCGMRCLPLEHADKIICLSNLEKEFVLQKFDRRSEDVVVIPNAVDLSRFRAESYDFRPKFGIRNEFMLLYVGQIIPVKGLHCLIEAFSAVRNAGFDCALTLISYNITDDLTEHARALGVEKSLHIINYLRDQLTDVDLVSAYRSSDLFVLPSLRECMPTVLLEAMASSKPVVATKVGGIPEIVADGQNGALCSPGSPRELADKITYFLDSPSAMRAAGAKGRTIVESNHDWKRIYPALKRLYLSLLE